MKTYLIIKKTEQFNKLHEALKNYANIYLYSILESDRNTSFYVELYDDSQASELVKNNAKYIAKNKEYTTFIL